MAQSARIFYSYSHHDRDLRDALIKHLSVLEQEGVIAGWSDREILPGADWVSAIDKNLEAADIILLLVDADFMASGYCAGIELKRALERADAGTAILIPILLRPVDLGDSVLARRQFLPSDGRALTKWGNRDEGFADIAAGIRRTADALRGKVQGTVIEMPERSEPAAERFLDAALSGHVAVGKPADLAVMIRLTSSQGLRAILEIEDEYSPEPEDVRSKRFEIEFPTDFRGRPQAVDVRLVVDAPDFRPPKQTKQLRVPPAGDSDVCTFFLTPQFTGELLVNLEVYVEASQCASRIFRIISEESDRVTRGKKLVSIPLHTESVAKPAAPRPSKRVSSRLATAASVIGVVSASVLLQQYMQTRPDSGSVTLYSKASPNPPAVAPSVDVPGPAVPPDQIALADPPAPQPGTTRESTKRSSLLAQQLKSVNGDLGMPSGLIATNPRELAALRSIGERKYLEFILDRTQRPRNVGGVLLSVEKIDPRRQRFTMRVRIDDKSISKANRTINEPLQFFGRGRSEPYEIVVNRTYGDSITGYMAMPGR